MPCNNTINPRYQPADAVKDLEAAIQAAKAANRERREEMKRQTWRR